MKEHRFVNHSKEYAKDGVHANIHHSVPDGLGDERYTLNQSLSALSVAFSSRFAFRIKIFFFNGIPGMKLSPIMPDK